MAFAMPSPGPEPDGVCDECGGELDAGACICAAWEAAMSGPEKAAFDAFCEDLRERLLEQRVQEMGELERDYAQRYLPEVA